MLSSTFYAIFMLSKTISPQKVFPSDCITLYKIIILAGIDVYNNHNHLHFFFAAISDMKSYRTLCTPSSINSIRLLSLLKGNQFKILKKVFFSFFSSHEVFVFIQAFSCTSSL